MDTRFNQFLRFLVALTLASLWSYTVHLYSLFEFWCAAPINFILVFVSFWFFSQKYTKGMLLFSFVFALFCFYKLHGRPQTILVTKETNPLYKNLFLALERYKLNGVVPEGYLNEHNLGFCLAKDCLKLSPLLTEGYYFYHPAKDEGDKNNKVYYIDQDYQIYFEENGFLRLKDDFK